MSFSLSTPFPLLAFFFSFPFSLLFAGAEFVTPRFLHSFPPLLCHCLHHVSLSHALPSPNSPKIASKSFHRTSVSGPFFCNLFARAACIQMLIWQECTFLSGANFRSWQLRTLVKDVLQFRPDSCFSMCVTELMSSDSSMQLGETVYYPLNNYYTLFVLYFSSIILQSRWSEHILPTPQCFLMIC